MSALLVFIFGLMTGSFLNVCIFRMPREESVVFPRSYCPACKKQIAWYDNIPLGSFLVLGAKCRACKAPISWRYFGVELLTGLVWLYLWLTHGWSIEFIRGIFFLSVLTAITFADFETGLIPDALTLPGMVAGFILAGIQPQMMGETFWAAGMWQSFLGILAGGGALWLTAVLGEKVFKKDSMGGGDIKLLAFTGAFLGWQGAVLVFFAAPFFALPFALYQRFIAKAETIPYGPYLALAAVLVYFAPNLLEYLGF